MTGLNVCKRAWLGALLCAGASIVSHAQTFTTIVNFDRANGRNPLATVIQNTDGNFYGTTFAGGHSRFCDNCGTYFRISRTGALITNNFCSQTDCTDGSQPLARLLQATDEGSYGTTYAGGANGRGTIFKISPRGQLTTVHDFDVTDGNDPLSSLIEGTDGNLYGITFSGGSAGWGAFFKLALAGAYTMLYSFDSTQAGPTGVIQANDGRFYGTTSANSGTHHSGTVFRITRDGTMTPLHSFCSQRSCADGAYPVGNLLQASDGNFYGMTRLGGVKNDGTIFRFTGGKLTTLYTFCSLADCADGAIPAGDLIQATDGNFYGTTSSGGANGSGTLFQITPEGTLTTLHSLNLTDGNIPNGLLQATDGKFYGTAEFGGTSQNCQSGCGTIFSLDIGLGPFVSLMRYSGRVGSPMGILGQGFSGTTNVSVNGTAATFTVVSDTYLTAKVPSGATTGFVTVTTPSGTLTSNQIFRVKP